MMASNSNTQQQYSSGSGSHHVGGGGGGGAAASSSRSNYQAGRRAKRVHNNEYNHDMEKQLQAHQNQAEFIPHDSFLKKFSTRTQHDSSQSQLQSSSLAQVQSHASLAVLSATDSNESNERLSSSKLNPAVVAASAAAAGATKQHRCSFKLDTSLDGDGGGGTRDSDQLEAGLLVTETNMDNKTNPTAATATATTSPIGGGGRVASPEESSPSSNLLVPLSSVSAPQSPINRAAQMFKRKNKSMSITSAMSNGSSLQLDRSCFDKILIKCNYFVFGPDDNPMFAWLFVLNFCVLYNIWLIIARQSFEKLQTEYQNYWRVADFIADTVYFLDVVIQFRTGYLEQGLLVYDSKKLALNYIKSKKFLLDLFAMTPLELIQLWYGYPIPILRFPRFFKLYRTIELYYITESRTLYPNVWRVANLTHILFCLGHWFAGFYFLISKAEGFRGHWSYPEPVDEFALLSRMYLRSLYWSTLTLTTIGDLPPPETNWQWLKEMSNFRYLFSIAVHYLAVFVIALIVGQVGNVITNRNANRVEFERLLDGAKQYMRNHNVPTEMQKRVQRWYDYSWSRGRMNGAGDIHSIGLLPDKLKTELALHVNLETLRKVTIFQECQPEFLHDLVLKMRASIFTPGDVICRRGEIAREMFIIADGVLEVIGESGQVLTKMYSGDFFGEIGILNIEGASNKRTADVRSVGYAELFSLSKEDVLTAVKDYPEAERILIEYGRRRLNQNLARKSSCRGASSENNPNQVGASIAGSIGGPITLSATSGVGINGGGSTTTGGIGGGGGGGVVVGMGGSNGLAPSLKITNESLASSKAASEDTLDNPSSPTSAGGMMHAAGVLAGTSHHTTPHHHHFQRHHHRRLSVAKLMSMKERAKFESEDTGSVTNDMLPSATEHRGLTTDMLGLPTLFNKQTQHGSSFSTSAAAAAAAAATVAATALDSSRLEVQSLLGSVFNTSDKLSGEREREKWLEIELMNANLGRSADSRKILDSLEHITSMCLNRNDVNMEQLIETINKLKDEIDAKKDAKYENFIDLVEQKDAKIKLLESRIKILQKYLTQREIVS